MMTDVKQGVRLRLAEVLKELGWTQKRLAEETGLSENAITNLLKNPRQVRLETLDAISRATGKEISELIVKID